MACSVCGRFARPATFRSLCCRLAVPKATRWRRSTPAQTITSRSRSARRSCWRAFAPRCAASSRRRRPTSRSCGAGSSSIGSASACSEREEEVRLTPKEFELLTYLAQRPGRVLTHRTILKAVWGPNAVDQPEHLRVLVASLRKKIEPTPSSPQYILTEPWVGYRFADEQSGLPPEGGSHGST